jgi:hypothetical protein
MRTPGRNDSGEILAEACIGLSLMALLWIMLSFTNYMANNRIRTAMAARDAAWLQANGESVQSVPAAFFLGQDTGLCPTPTSQPNSYSYGVWTASASTSTVTFGLQGGDSSNATTYPFVLLNTTLPYMPASAMNGFLQVQANCAWPGDLTDTYNSSGAALSAGASP